MLVLARIFNEATMGFLALFALATALVPLLFDVGAGTLSALHESSFPRLETGPRWSALTLWLPQARQRLHRDPVLLLIAGEDMLSLAPGSPGLMDLRPGSEPLPWGVRCALGVIRRHLARYEDLAGRLEADVRKLELLRADDSPESFFEEVFRLKLDLGTAKGDLWRLRGILDKIADGRRSLLGMNLADSPWTITLGQVAFGALMLVLSALYLFLAKGWIR